MSDPRQTPAQRELIERVRTRMAAGRLRLEDIAKEVGCSTSNLCRIFKGKIGLKPSIEERLAASFPVEEASIESVVAMIRGLSPVELVTVLQIMQLVRSLRKVDAAD